MSTRLSYTLAVRFCSAVLLSGLTACDALPGSTGSASVRDSAGIRIVEYAADLTAADSLEPDLRIGKVSGEAYETFGSVRGIEVAPDGTIFVLDGQATEIRAFNADGSYRATIARGGEGPGEIRQANGLLLAPDGTLWVQDHRAGSLLVLSQQGGEVERHPMLVRGWGYEWEAMIDPQGTIWQTWGHAITERAPGPPPQGLNESRSREYAKSYVPSTRTYDSILIGESVSRYLSFSSGPNSYTNAGLPFAADMIYAIDRSGGVWSGRSDRYRLTRIDGSGNPTVILDVAALGEPLTDEERQERQRIFEQAGVTPEFPERKPVMRRLIVDDEGQLWVQRVASEDAGGMLDGFSVDGDWLGSVVLPAGMATYPSPIIRGGRLYGVWTDELDVQYVVRVPLPVR